GSCLGEGGSLQLAVVWTKAESRHLAVGSCLDEGGRRQLAVVWAKAEVCRAVVWAKAEVCSWQLLGRRRKVGSCLDAGGRFASGRRNCVLLNAHRTPPTAYCLLPTAYYFL
ncbi:MAG: hypothetical protein M3Q95_03695, partial [Bacteroidota bacterium]|nr:hypothetical protein [Bacteroidota bacterium]